MEHRRILVILNPVSGQGEYSEIRAEVEARLLEEKVPYQLKETEGEGDALQWAEEASDFSLVIVGGGDGTVMEAMTGMIRNPNPIPLAQLGMGTANLLARALAIPVDIEGGLNLALRDGVSTKMDVGYLEEHDRYFALVAGFGWDAKLIGDADRELKNRMGFFAYVWTGVKNLFQLRNSRVTLSVDGEVHRLRAHTVEVINVGEIYGTGIALGEGLNPHDGKLNIAIASTHTVWGLIKLVFRLLLKKFDHSSELQYFSAEKIKVEAHPVLPLQADGEKIGETPCSIRVVPNGVVLVVPEEYAESKKLDYEKLKQ